MFSSDQAYELVPYVLQGAAILLALLLVVTAGVREPLVAGTASLLAAIERRPARAALVAATLWCGWLAFRFVADDRSPAPHWHDEQAYLLQARMMASGRLALPSPAEPDFYDTFHVFVRPVYASKYPPGTALAYVPGMWLGVHWLATAFAIAFASTYLVCLVGTRFVGAWAVPIVLAFGATSGMYVAFSVQALSQTPVIALAAVAWACCQRVRVRPSAASFLVLGAAGGWAFITRPIDAVILIAPAAALASIACHRARGVRSTLVYAAIAIAAGAPFVALMLADNRAITGSAFAMPWTLYARVYQPGERLGFGTPSYGVLPIGLPQQKYDYYSRFAAVLFSLHTPARVLASWRIGGDRLENVLEVAAVPKAFVAALALAIVGGWRRAAWPAVLMAAGTCVLYSLYAFNTSLYFLPLAVLLWLGIARGVEPTLARLPAAWRPAWRAGVLATLALTVLLSQLPVAANVRSRSGDNGYDETRRFERRVLPTLQRPAIVFFRYGPPASWHDERVYNIETARPEDADVLRVHWLGPRNADLLRSLAATRATSRVYLYDRRDGRLSDLGLLPDVLARGPATARAAATGASR